MEVFGFKLIKQGQAEYVLTTKTRKIYFFATEKLLSQMDQAVFHQAINLAESQGLVGPVCIMPDAHSGYGAPIGSVFAADESGFVFPGAIGFDINCGMRLLVTNLTAKELEPYIEKLVAKLYEMVPAGVGKKGFLSINKNQLRSLTQSGVPFLVKELGLGWAKDIEAIEERGGVQPADFEFVSDRAVARGLAQLATLGSGNHYLEIQKVEKLFDKQTAGKYSIFTKDQVVVMLHCGSRGFGHQICSDYLIAFEKQARQQKIKLTDRQLAGLPIMSQLGQAYLSAMGCAANYAFVNRQAITYQIRRCFEIVLGGKAQDYNLSLVYDVSHNIGKFEQHNLLDSGVEQRVFVQRKGATRSFPNQPVIIGGSMETGSYLLLGTSDSLKKSFGSTAHGAGRRLSRTQAKKQIDGRKLWQDLKQKGIYIKSASFSGLAEEAGLAYKDVSEVVSAVSAANLSRPIAYFKPIGNIKG
ncbi:MAG: RNA-splicing ligase RtcB [Patescibacteria group bacterium]|nr:MAG: RNA-splicing ligase RtcB [Patescibacteria group bacterium]